jgi:cell division protein FtsI (penicillin-binding protein 3)
MLETVVSAEGSGLKAAITNYRVAGKTGTSRAASGGGYDNRHISLFVGMVPASNPWLVGVVVIHDPQGAYYGGLVSAPVFSKVMDGALRLLDVPPDNVKNWYTGSPQGAPTLDAKVPASPEENLEMSNYAEGVPP